MPSHTEEEKNVLKTLDMHHVLAKHQSKAFHEDRCNLCSSKCNIYLFSFSWYSFCYGILVVLDECIVVQDFSKFYTRKGKVSDLVLVIYFKKEELEWKYLDYFTTDPQDFYTVQAIWLHLLGESREIEDSIQHIIIWSDGAKQHFKQAKTMYWFSELAEKLNMAITWNFFASCHGHSICDSHTGNGKQQIARFEREQNKQVENLSQLCQIYDGQLSRTKTYTITTERHSTLSVKSFNGISLYHQFIFNMTGRMKCRKFSNEGDCEEKIIQLSGM